MIRDRKYLDWLRTQRCIFTGLYGNEENAVEAMHVGTAGKGLKSSDDEALPALHSIHHGAHQKGEMTTIREMIPDDVLRLALRAYARELYQQYKAEVAASERVENAKNTIRALARAEFGRDDDATCFHIAATLLCNEQQGGFHRSPPSVITELKLDKQEPVE